MSDFWKTPIIDPGLRLQQKFDMCQIPLIISSPKYSAKDNSDSFTELVDIYPTLCELAGITPPNYIQGKSLTAVLENPKTILKDEVYTRYKQGEAVIDKNYSYTEFVQGNKYLGNMLYDMKNDKEQNVDISKLPENKALVKKYSIKLEEMRNYVNKDPFQNE